MLYRLSSIVTVRDVVPALTRAENGPALASRAAESFQTPLLGAVTEPDPKLARLYDGAFGIYKETREKMRPLWRAMVANRAS